MALIPGGLATMIAVIATLIAGCDQRLAAPDPEGGDAVCIADSLPSIPTCAADGWLCRVKCRWGDGSHCLGLAYSAERYPTALDNAKSLFKRACVLGEAKGCTNHAASTWARNRTDAQRACARCIFEKACAAKEAFACGMVGRIMIETTMPPYGEGRRDLQRVCDQLGGFSCRVLAMYMESGKFGEYRPERIPSLLIRAFAGGDSDACGTHATASGTVHRRETIASHPISMQPAPAGPPQATATSA